MEDYKSAAEARLLDVEVLLQGANPRCTAASHLGGAAVECRLKALVAKYHNIGKWGEKSSRVGDPKSNQPISNPGHSLASALKAMPSLYNKAKLDSDFLIHLSRMMHPVGATTMDFIALRYYGKNLAPEALASWRGSFKYVVGWLKKNEVFV